MGIKGICSPGITGISISPYMGIKGICSPWHHRDLSNRASLTPKGPNSFSNEIRPLGVTLPSLTKMQDSTLCPYMEIPDVIDIKPISGYAHIHTPGFPKVGDVAP